VVWADELRLGLHGQVRRRWTLRGHRLRQRVQVVYRWRYLALAVTPNGILRWAWTERVRQEQIAALVEGWRDDGVAGIVWDNAPGHTARSVRALAVPLVPLPPYAPELNPAERVFQEIRRRVEGLVWADLDAKMAAVDAYLTALADDPLRLQRLVGWHWLTTALHALPNHLRA
jgi:hypothetical protein